MFLSREDQFQLSLGSSIDPGLVGRLIPPLLEYSGHVAVLRQKGSLLSRKYQQAVSGHDLDQTMASR